MSESFPGPGHPGPAGSAGGDPRASGQGPAGAGSGFGPSASGFGPTGPGASGFGPTGPGASGFAGQGPSTTRSASGAWPAAGAPGAGHTQPRQGSQRFVAASGEARPGSDRLAGPRVGPYELLSELGRGSSGTVYLARRAGIDRMFALKLLPEELDPEGRARLAREANVSSRIEHPGVVAATDVGSVGGRLFMVMEYVPGETLRDHLTRRGGRLPWSEARDLVAALAEALQAAHDAGVVHRDLKPANVLLDARDGRPRVTDFGLARDAASAMSLTREGDVIGTPYYMSPEQVQGRRADPRTDVYALGVILYELISGERPFQAHNVATLVDRILRERPPSPRKRWPEIPPALERVCLKAMAREPAQRFASARELERALREVAVETSAPAPARRPVAWPALVGAGLLALVPPALAFPTWRLAEGRAEAAGEDLARAQRERKALQAQLAERQERLRTRSQAPPPPPAPTPVQRDPREALDELLAWQVELDPYQAQVLDRAIEELRARPGCAALAGALLRDRGRDEEALELVRAARQAGDPDPDLLVVEFRTLARLGRETEAREALEQLARLEPEGSPRGTFARVILGRYPTPQAALKALEDACRQAPELVYLHVLSAMQAVQRGALEETHAAVDRALRAEPCSPDARRARMEALVDAWARRPASQNELELLIVDARDWRSVRPDAEAWLLCGVGLVEAGHTWPGLRELRECLRRADRAPQVRIPALAWSLGALGRDDPGGEFDATRRELLRALPDESNLAAALAPVAGWLRRVDPAALARLVQALPPRARDMLGARSH